MRNNSLIVLIAVGIVLVIHSLKEADPKGLMWFIAMILLVFGSHQMVNTYYEKISGLEVSEGMPYISWIRMGLQEIDAYKLVID